MGIYKFFDILKNSTITKSSIKLIKLKKLYNFDNFLIDFNFIIYFCNRKLCRKFIKLNNYISNISPKNSILKKFVDFSLSDSKDTFLNLNNTETNNILNIDDLLVYECIKFLKKYIYKNKKNFIVFNGIPKKRKMINQKNYRYLLSSIETIKNCFHYSNNNFDSVYDVQINSKKDYEIVQLFKKQKLKIIPGSELILKLSFELKNNFIGNNIIIDDCTNNGEDEEKIFEYIKLIPENQSICIFSPDSDFIAMSLNQSKHIYILIHMKLEFHNIININKLRNNIIEFLSKNELPDKSESLSKNELPNKKEILDKNEFCNKNRIDILTDIRLLISFFGNDFLPKNIFTNVYNFKDILSIYKTSLTSNNKKIFINNKINLESFKILINSLIPLENKEKKYKFIKDNYVYYTQIINTFEKELLQVDNLDYNFIDLLINNIVNLYNLFINKLFYKDNIFYLINNDYFIEKLKKCINISIKNLPNHKIIYEIKRYYKINGKWPNITISTLKKNKSINEYFFKKIINDNNIKNTEIFKLENLLQPYNEKFNVKNFNLDQINDKLIKNYLSCLINNVINVNQNWYYNYKNICPTFEQIYKFLLKEENFEIIYSEITPTITFNSIEYIIYIYPHDNDLYELLPHKYKKIILEKKEELLNLGISYDINNIINDIILSRQNKEDCVKSKEIDGLNCKHFNNCTLINLPIVDEINEMEFINLINF